MRVLKLEVAARQLDAAICTFFDAGDPVVIHSLAASAANIFSDVAEHRNVGVSWRTYLQNDNNLTVAELKSILHRSWNFFKHADRDPDAELEFEEIDSEHLMFLAILDAGTLCPISCPMQAFQLWYIAAYPDNFPSSEPVFEKAASLFPNLPNLEKWVSVLHGRAFLNEQCKQSRTRSEINPADSPTGNPPEAGRGLQPRPVRLKTSTIYKT